MKLLIKIIILKLLFFVQMSSAHLKTDTYKNDFAILNKSYIKDLKRSFYLYESYERFSEEKWPFYMVVPKKDIDSFVTFFDKQKKNKLIKGLPVFLSEEEVLSMSGEPVEATLKMPGYYVQQVIKLCFGLTNLSKHYFIIDSDIFFTKPFNKSILYDNQVLKFSFHQNNHSCKNPDNISGHGDHLLHSVGVSYYEAEKTIKLVLKNKDDCYRNYVSASTAFDSDILYRFKKYLVENGLVNFTNIIRIVPFEFQWYGEFLYTYGHFIAMSFVFDICESNVRICKLSKDSKKIGVVYPSTDWRDRKNPKANKFDKPDLVYK